MIAGITKHTDGYAIVMRYYEKGDLRTTFKEELTWLDRVSRLFQIVKGVDLIHEKGWVHCDLHSGNILVNNNIIIKHGGINLPYAQGITSIADFGQCRRTTECE